MYFLIYSSGACVKYNDAELTDLLVECREFNKQHNITGMLLYFKDEFLQLIEGSEYDVTCLYKRIEKDNRHKDLLIMKEGGIEERFFKNWSMAFKSLSAAELETNEGYFDPSASRGKNTAAVFNLFKILSTEI